MRTGVCSLTVTEYADELLALNYGIKLCSEKLLEKRQFEVDNLQI